MTASPLSTGLPLLLAGLCLLPLHAAPPTSAPLKAAEINQPDRFGATPFLDAILEGDVELVTRQIEAGADVNHIPVIAEEILLLGDNPYYTPLLTACEARHTHKAELVQLLLSAGADPNLTLPASQWSPLMSAAATGSPALVQLLLQAGADPHRRNDDDATPLLLAARVQSVESIRALLKAGADPRIKDAQGSGIYHAILDSHAIIDAPPIQGVPARVVLIQMMHARGADLNHTDHEGNSPLIKVVKMNRSYSSEQESLEIARCLIQLGAKIQLTNKRGESALSLAQKEGKSTLSDYLKETSQ